MNKKSVTILILVLALVIPFIMCQNGDNQNADNNNSNVSESDSGSSTETDNEDTESTSDTDTEKDVPQIDIPEKYIGKYVGEYSGLGFYIVINGDGSYSAVIADSPLFFGNVSKIVEENGFDQLILDIASSKDNQKAKLEFYNKETKLVTPNNDIISLRKQ